MKCHWCGEKKATIKAYDPFAEELGLLEEDEREEWWCGDCYQKRIWEI